MSAKFTKDVFIKNSIAKHGHKYDYSLVDYVNSSKKVIIICKEHGSFEQRASNHLRGRGCNKCKKSKKYNSDKFIELSKSIHGDKYDYGKLNYKSSHSNVIITCKKHGDFEQLATNHLSGRGCSKCARESTRIEVDDFINRCNEVHNFKYNYDLVVYKNLRNKIEIICKEHGVFKQRSKNHLDGQGCPKCGDFFGVKENKWLDILGIKERQVRIGKYIVDGYDPDTNTIYEFNGDFWHGNPELYDSSDMNNVLNKTFGELYKKTIKREEYLIKKGYNVVSIWENDFNKNSY